MIAPVDQPSRDMPPLGPALIAMTGTQAVVALALFAPGVLAPKLGLHVADVSLFATTVFAVGMATSLYGGLLAQRFGPCRVAGGCFAAVALGMLLASAGPLAWLLAGGICVGLAFGPETPASSALLGRLARADQRPLVFSVRQTGNQIGAIVGSLSLPLIALIEPRRGYLMIAIIAASGAAILLRLSRRYDWVARDQTAASMDLRSAARLVLANRPLAVLAMLSMPFSAMQFALNAYLVAFATGVLLFDHVAAGILLAVAQVGGLGGRLFWGLVATRWISPRNLLCGIGVGMAVAAVTIALMGPWLSLPALYAVAFLFGLTASGWNGIFLAEVARLAPPDRVAEATGGVLTASYAGLLAAPLLVATAANFGTLVLSYVALAVLVLALTLVLFKSREKSS